MRVTLGLVLAVAACGDSATSGGELTLSEEASSNNKLHAMVPLEESVAGHLPNNFGGELGELIFNAGAPNDAVWIHIIFAEPVATGTRTITTDQPAQLDAGFASLEYTELGINRRWVAQSGTLAITTADVPVVTVEASGLPMAASTSTDATGTFTLALTATATEYDSDR